MNKTLIFGATGHLGQMLCKRLVEAGGEVVTFVRPESDYALLQTRNVTLIFGDATSGEDVHAAFEQFGFGGWVISTLAGAAGDGVWVDDLGNRNVIDAAKQAQVQRLLLITAIGCGEMSPFRSPQAIAAFGSMVDAKTRAEDYLRSSGLPFTIIRPGGLRNEPATGNGILCTDPQVHGYIHRDDLAELTVRCMRDDRTIGGVYAAVDQNQARCANPLHPMQLLY